MAVVVPDARNVSHQLSQGDGPLFPWELRHVGLNFVVEMQRAFLEKQADGGRGERLGCVPDPESHARRYGHAPFHIRPAETFSPYDLASNADRHRQPRQVLPDETSTRELSRLVHRRSPLR